MSILPFAGLSGGEDSFYVWKRDWSEPVKEAVAAEKSAAGIFFLAGEFERKGYAAVSPDWAALKASGVPMTPVYRVRAAFVGDASIPGSLASKFKSLIADAGAAGLALKSIQIDLDCPESKLELYAKLLKELRTLLPEGTEISATVLPCHVLSKGFAPLAEAADFFTLQVHGLDYPKDRTQTPKLMDKGTAFKALDAALSFKRPFMLALPCYAYQANFSRKDGKLLFISAEDLPPSNPDIEARLVEASPQELAETVKLAKGIEDKNFRGIVWFRLPVKGDALCIDRASLSIVQRGETPRKSVRCLWTKKGAGLIILEVENSAVLGAGKVEIKLHWPSGISYDYDFLNGFRGAGDCLPGLPPQEIIGSAAPPGVRTAAAWFRSAAPFVEPAVEINLK